MPVTVHEFKAEAICVLAKFASNLFNFSHATPECKKVGIMLKAQSESSDRLVTKDTDLYDEMFYLISKYNSELKEFHNGILTDVSDNLDTSNEGEYLEMCDVLKTGHNQTTEMLDALKSYEKLISAHLVMESNSIMVTIRD
jgi:hypothetical protein